MYVSSYVCMLFNKVCIIQRVREVGLLKRCHFRYYLYLIIVLYLKPKSLDQNWLAGIFVCLNTTIYQLKDWHTIDNNIYAFSKANGELRRLERATSATVIISYPLLSNKAAIWWNSFSRRISPLFHEIWEDGVLP